MWRADRFASDETKQASLFFFLLPFFGSCLELTSNHHHRAAAKIIKHRQVAELMRARLRQDWDEAKRVAQETGGDPDEAVAGMQSGEELFDEINKG